MSPPSAPPRGPPARGLNLSFAGCGFLGIYHVGAAACLRRWAPQLGVQSIAGASAGAMAAACLLSGADLGIIRATIVRAAAEARVRTFGPFSLKFDLQQRLRDGLTQVLPANAHELVGGRLLVSVTRVADGKNLLLSTFDTREDLLQALLCSSFIPLFSGLRPVKLGGVRYMDGGFTDNLPVLDEATITVSPFSGEADICPRDGNTAGLMTFSVTNSSFRMNAPNIQRFVQAVFPPPPDHLHRVCQQGFDDTLDFLLRNGLLSCTRCPALLSSLSLPSLQAVASTPSFTPATRRIRTSRSERNMNEDATQRGRRAAAGGTTTALTSLEGCQARQEEGAALSTAQDSSQGQQDPRGRFYLGDVEAVTSQGVAAAGAGCPLDELESWLQDSQHWASSCVHCPDCRQQMQEAVMAQHPPMSPDQVHPDHERLGLMVHPPARSSARHVVRIMVLPVTLTVRIPLSIVTRLVSLVPAGPVLGLQSFTRQMVQLVRQLLLARRRAVARERHQLHGGAGGGRAVDAARGPASHRRAPRHPPSPQPGSCLYVCLALPGGPEAPPVLWDAHSLRDKLGDSHTSSHSLGGAHTFSHSLGNSQTSSHSLEDKLGDSHTSSHSLGDSHTSSHSLEGAHTFSHSLGDSHTSSHSLENKVGDAHTSHSLGDKVGDPHTSTHSLRDDHTSSHSLENEVGDAHTSHSLGTYWGLPTA